ncbi:MAG: alpha/beta fold hydrolase [Planctomycetota bacterium]|jgi:pimeloyl-ACP methyl ester carboxylesterase
MYPKNTRRYLKIAALALAAITLSTGCRSSTKHLRTPNRYKKGYVIVLPGVEGRSRLNVNIAEGLKDGGIKSAIEIYDWTAFRVLSVIVNLRAEIRNRRQARKIAKKIMFYQDQYPGKPVHIIGHSGGGYIAVLTLEALPPERRVQSAILLGPAVTPNYDLRRALRRTKHGIWNFYSPRDVFFLKFGTTLMGTVDGRHTYAAGAVGFTLPWGLDRQDRQLYKEKLYQKCYRQKMAQSGHDGTHFGWAKRRFVAEWLAPIINTQIDNQNRQPSTKPSK